MEVPLITYDQYDYYAWLSRMGMHETLMLVEAPRQAVVQTNASDRYIPVTIYY